MQPVHPYRERQKLRQSDLALRRDGREKQESSVLDTGSSKRLSFFSRATSLIVQISGFCRALITIAAVAALAWIFYLSLNQRVLIIRDITAPSSFADAGFSSEVLSRKLRESIIRIIDDAQPTEQQSVSMRSELIDIVVPSTGISIQIISDNMRALLGIKPRDSIAGFIFNREGLSYISLQLNGNTFYTSSEGVKLDNLEDLFPIASLETLKITRPLVYAIAVSNINTLEALRYAESIIDNQSREDDTVRDARLLKGSLLSSLKRYHEAAAWYDAMTASHPRDAGVYVGRGNLHVLRSDFKGALDQYRNAVDVDPQSVASHISLGIGLVRVQRRIEAIEQFKAAISLEPRNAFAHNNLGNVYRELGSLDDAAREYRVAISSRPKWAEPYNGLGDVLHAMRRRDDSEIEYRHAIVLDDSSPLFHFNLGNLLRDKGRLVDAISEFNAALAREPNMIEARVNLCNLHWRLRQKSEWDFAKCPLIGMNKAE